MALGRGNIEIDVGARGLTQDIVRQVRAAEKKIRPLSVSLNEKGFRQPLGRISGDLAEFQKSLDASVARTLAFGAAVGVLNAVTQGFKAMIQSAAEVEKKLTDINVILNLNANSLADFSSKLFDAAKNTGQSFETVSDAAVELSRQGLGAEETLKRINDAMILTRLSGMDAAKSVETLTAAVNSFGDSALTTTELVNKLATVDAAFAVSTEDLANGLARAGSTAQAAKVNLNELLAAVTSVQQITARGGAVIGNAFKSIFTRLQRSGVREALEEIGVATTDSFGNIRGALGILKDYAGVYSTLSDSQRAYTDELIAGVFQINNLKALVKDLGSDYSIYERALNQSNNATDEAVRRNEKLQGTLSALINEASVNAKELASTLGDLVATPAVENLLKIFNSISGALSEALDPEKGNKLIQNMFKSIGSFISGPGLILIGVAFVKLFKFITGQSIKAVQEIFKIGSATNKIAEAEAKIGFLLKNNKNLYEAISNEALSHEQKEELVLQTIKAQNKAYAQQQAMVSRLAGSRAVGGALAKSRASGFIPSASGGYIPNFTKKIEGAISSERSAIAAGEGGASRSAKPKVLNNFPIGGGRKETIVANTDEVIVPKFGGSSGSAVFNQDMIKTAGGVPEGAVPVARGFVPNFASSLKKNKEYLRFLNSKDSLTIDVEKQLGGFGMISAAGTRGRQSASLQRMSGFSAAKNDEIINKIGGSKLTQEDKKYISGVISKKGTKFDNIGTSSIKQMESASVRSSIQGKAGAINEIVQPYMAEAVASVSSRIYNSILGDEVGSNLVSNVRKQANVDSTIVSPSVEGGVFESALRLGNVESAKSLGRDSSEAIWDFEEAGRITKDMQNIFFGGYNISKGDAKRAGGATSLNQTIEKSHKDFFNKPLEDIYTQHWSPFFEIGNKLTEGKRKSTRAKSGLARAGGFVPNYVFAESGLPNSIMKIQPRNIPSTPIGKHPLHKTGFKENKTVKQLSKDNKLSKARIGKKNQAADLIDSFYATIIPEYQRFKDAQFRNWAGGMSDNSIKNESYAKRIFGGGNSLFKKYGADQSAISSLQTSYNTIKNFQKAETKFKAQRKFKNFDRFVKSKPEYKNLIGVTGKVSKFQDLKNNFENKMKGTIGEITAAKKEGVRIQSGNSFFDLENGKEVKTVKGKQKASDILRKGANGWLDKNNIFNDREDKVSMGEISVILPRDTILASGGFIPNYSGQIKGFGRNSVIKDKTAGGKRTLDVQYIQGLFGEGSSIFRKILSNLITADKQKRPYTNIDAGDVVGPRIPSVLVKGKKLLDNQRRRRGSPPLTKMEGVMNPSRLMERLLRNKDDVTADAGEYYEGEESVLENSLKSLGTSSKENRQVRLETLPFFKRGFASGYIPNFANSLEEAIVREKEALSDQKSGAQVYVDQDDRLKGSKNPMGLLVANTRDEPISGSQGVDRALATGINPKNHGMGMSGGHIPNFSRAIIKGAVKDNRIGKLFTGIKDNIFKTILGLELLVTPILQSLGAEFNGFSSAIGDAISFLIKGTGSLLGMNIANQELIESNEKYQESVEKQINIISQNIEKVDKFAQTLAILGQATEKNDVGAIGKTIQNLLNQAGDLQNIDSGAFKELLSSIGDSEKLKESTQNLKDLIEQGKNLKTFGSDFAELVNKLEGKDSFKDADIGGDQIKNITSQLTANLSPEKFAKLNDELKGFNVDSGNSIAKIISLQSVLGQFDETLISNISQSKELTQETLRALKAQAAYKESSKALTEALTGNLLPVTNLNKQFDRLANVITASAVAMDKSYKTLSEISKIQSDSRLNTLKGTGTVTSTDLIKGQSAADIKKVTQDAQKTIESSLRSFTSKALEGSDKGSTIEGTLKSIVDNIANGGSTEESLKLLAEIQRNGNDKQKAAAEKTIEAIKSASQDEISQTKILEAKLEAQLQSERVQAVSLSRNNQLSEDQLKSLSDFSNSSKGQAENSRSTLQEISNLNQIISTIEGAGLAGAGNDILAEIKESNSQLSQLENFKEALNSLSSAAGVTFDAESLVELDAQVEKFILSDSFGELGDKAQSLVAVLNRGIDTARAVGGGGVKSQEEVEKASDRGVSDESINSLAKQFSDGLSGPLSEALRIGPEIAAVLSTPINDIQSIAQSIQTISLENSENIKSNIEVQKRNAETIAKAVSAMQGSSSGGVSESASKMEKAADMMLTAAREISGSKAGGFVPSFSPMGEQVARAVRTERALGGQPVVDYNKQVGTYVRDGRTQPNFAAVKRDHPEGIKKATQNSRLSQGALSASGFVPNFDGETSLDYAKKQKTKEIINFMGGKLKGVAQQGKVTVPALAGLGVDLAIDHFKNNASPTIKKAYFGGDGVPPFVDQSSLKSGYEKLDKHVGAEEAVFRALKSSGHENYNNIINSFSQPYVNEKHKNFKGLMFNRMSEYPKWNLENNYGTAEKIAEFYESLGDKLSLAALALGVSSASGVLAPVTAPAALAAGALSVGPYAVSTLAKIFSDYNDDPSTLSPVYEELMSQGFFARNSTYSPEDFLYNNENGVQQLTETALRTKDQSGMLSQLLLEAGDTGKIKTQLFNQRNSKLKNTNLSVGERNVEIANKAFAAYRYGSSSKNSAFESLINLDGSAGFISNATAYKSFLGNLNNEFRIPFDFKEGDFVASEGVGWKVGNTPTKWSIDELKNSKKLISSALKEKQLYMANLNAAAAKKAKTSPEESKELFGKLARQEQLYKTYQEADALTSVYIQQFEKSQKDFSEATSGEASVFSGKKVLFPNPVNREGGLFPLELVGLSGGASLTAMAKNFESQNVSALSTNNPSADAQAFLDATFKNRYVAESAKHIDSILKTDFNSFLTSASILDPKGLSQGFKNAQEVLQKSFDKKDIEGQDKMRPELDKTILNQKNLEEAGPGGIKFGDVKQEDIIKQIGSDPNQLVENLQKEKQDQASRKSNIRDQLYLQLLGQEAEQVRSSQASIQMLDRINRIKEKEPFLFSQLDQMSINRHKRIETIEKNPSTFAQKKIPQIQAEIQEIEKRKMLYQTDEGLAYLFFAKTGSPDSFSDIGPEGKKIGPPVYESIPDYSQKFNELKQKLRIDQTEPEQRIQELKNKGGFFEDFKFDTANPMEEYLNFARIRSLKGEPFKNFFSQSDADSRVAIMRSLGATDELPGNQLISTALNQGGEKLRQTLSQNLLKVGGGDAAFGFLVNEVMNHGIGLGEDDFIKAINKMGVPFHSTQGVDQQLNQSTVKIAGLPSLKNTGFEEAALEKSDIDKAISLMSNIQMQDWLEKNKKEAQGGDNNPFGFLTETLADVSHEQLMQKPLYIKYLKDNFGYNVAGYLTSKGKNGVQELNSWKESYRFKDKLWSNKDYGKIQWNPDIKNQPEVDEEGLNKFRKFQGVNTALELAKSIYGEELYFGANSNIDNFLNDRENPFPKLRAAGWENRTNQAVSEFSEIFKNNKKLDYAPYGYDYLSEMKKAEPNFNPEGLEPEQIRLLLMGSKNKEEAVAAKGFVPNFSAIAGEIAASKMAGYKSTVSSSQVKTMNIPGVGKTAYNTQESVFKMPGMSQPFIAPPSNSKAATGYRKAVEKKFNFNPYAKTAADGFVPNFANGDSGLKSAVSGLESFVRSFGDNVASFEQALSGLNFEQLTSASQQIVNSASEFSRQSSTIKEAADIFKQGANGISQVKTEKTDSGNIDQSASLIQQSVDGLSKELQKNIKVDSSTITEPINGLTKALSTVRGEIEVKVPNINVSVNGASAVSSSIKTILQQQIPAIVQQVIAQEKSKLIQEIRGNIF